MSPKALEDYLHQHIPLSAAMAVSVAEASGERVILHAPLAPNINHRATVFGGSASAVAILTAWCLVFMRLRERGLPGRVIIHGNSMRYDKPIAAGFLARAAAPDAAAWDKLERALRRGRMGRLRLEVALECDGEAVGSLEGEFVVLPGEGDSQH
ncbi:YiiD C-terminal domain-containing protein [Chromobacterium aquaticum]|uniref:YiiD C-terminal domain-containing protein n=1 Tax=Chromobacterium aquaticum TaxID=467180 RepID=A0ABV8ZVD2_9NEIS|nr:YiiD C-terminal domain-containing protein [Chromobacterium aquaticum]MCD5360675.1 thioesterase domain-containing protein [Chromobacterium aquaticum]